MKQIKFYIHLLTLLIPVLTAGQTSISGVINKYSAVTSVTTGSVTVSSVLPFTVGDTVMIIQMKGALYSQTAPLTVADIRNTGKYEITIINQIINGANQIIFSSPLQNTYDASESVQLVKIPSYDNARITAALTCDSWDGSKGGILAMIVNGTLEMNANIDVSNKGFRGSSPGSEIYNGICFGDTYSAGNGYKFTLSAKDSSGFKGEGLITNAYYSVYPRGIAPSGTGGGGGAGKYSGGGGGGNVGAGGNGGAEQCIINENTKNWGGYGGRIDKQYFANRNPLAFPDIYKNRIYFGGGGGSGTQGPSGGATRGGNGGGIVLILTPHIKGNGYSIFANGETVSSMATNTASAGGGGGGGMILLAVDSVRTSLNLFVRGGNGGNTSPGVCTGHGGGGGGGFVWCSGNNLTITSIDKSGGLAGSSDLCISTSFDGGDGDTLNNLILPLSGFLFNIIKSDQIICYNTKAATITGTQPKGGDGTFVYQWQNKTRLTTWSPAPGINNQKDYKSQALTDTTYFRRIVTSAGISDTSKSIVVKVFPQITNNTINPDTTICYGSSKISVRGTVPSGGKGSFVYDWRQRPTKGSWSASLASTQNFSNTSTADSMYYKRDVIFTYNGKSCSISDSVIINVLPPIGNNLINPRQTICYNMKPVKFTGQAPSGGDKAYKYNWQQSNDSLTWTNTGVTVSDFNTPPALTQTRYYRRIVISGLSDCCKDTSKNIKVIVLPSVTSNTIAASQTICQDTKPAVFTGSNPGGGDSPNYRYQWLSSFNQTKWDSVTTSASLKDFQNDTLKSTRYFRRVVRSGLLDCCKDTSTAIKITVQPRIANNTVGNSQTICKNAAPIELKTVPSASLTGGDGTSYTPLWQQRSTKGLWLNAKGINNQLNYQPPVLTDSTYFRRRIISGSCTHYSDSIFVKVLASINGNILEGNHEACEKIPATQLTGGSLTGGEPGVYKYAWLKSLDNSTWQSVTGESGSNLSPGVLPADHYFKRIAVSGLNDCCKDTSASFKIAVFAQPEVPDAGSLQELTYKFTTKLEASAPTAGSGEWTSNQDNVIISNKNSNITDVSGLSFGKNVFYWTITNSVCPIVSDSVIIQVSDLERYTGFSPNGDNVNDYFVIDGVENAAKKELSVLNRWGVEVFHSSDYKNDWNGENKNGMQLPEDTYFYILKVDDKRVYKGYVVLKR